jgi:hypothetical protein
MNRLGTSRTIVVEHMRMSFDSPEVDATKARAIARSVRDLVSGAAVPEATPEARRIALRVREAIEAGESGGD